MVTGFTANTTNKIKGGKWTVFKFAAVAVGYTIVWMALCSELNTFRELYGPSILLKMNFVYYLPSIPLLILSSYVDAPLERSLGVAMTVLLRLLVGSGTCAVIAFIFPFEPNRLSYLLWTLGVLGLAHGISFSASYQLASRYANKNTIALGLGCVGSGALVLFLEIALQMGAHPSVEDEYLLYFICGGAVLLSLMSSVSLLLRHWRAIDAAAMGLAATGDAQKQFEDSLRRPLLHEEPSKRSLVDSCEQPPQSRLPPCSATTQGEDHHLHATGPGTSHDLGRTEGRALHKPNSVHALVALAPLDFFKTVSDGEATLLIDGHTFHPDSMISYGDAEAIAAEGGRHRLAVADHTPHTNSHIQSATSSLLIRAEGEAAALPQPLRASSRPDELQARGSERKHPEAPEGHSDPGEQRRRQRSRQASAPQAARGCDTSDATQGSSSAIAASSADSGREGGDCAMSAFHVMRCMWHCQLSLFISGSISLMVFPLVTYVPTSGTFGDLLPKWLFFVRLFADLAGRLLPRARTLAVHRPIGVLIQAGLLIILTPLFYLYILFAPTWFLSDSLACVYIAVMYILNGMVNTNVYTMVPKLMRPEHKSSAAGLLAVTYQGAHVMGLIGSAVLCLTLLDKKHT